jgi:magnesium-protoporphyrin IX monomethyl ester (oxidative) cyclase
MDAIGAEFMMEDTPLRLEYLAAAVRPHVEFVEIVDLNKEKRPFEHFLGKHRPDLVGVTLNYISTHRSSLLVAAEAKKHGADVVFGGYLATALASEFAASPDVDFVVRGEGELTLIELAGPRPLSTILGLSYSEKGALRHNGDRPLIEDLDSIPFPERHLRKHQYALPFADLSPDANTAYEMIITSRGCWGRCTFCTEPMMSHGHQRYRRPEKVIEEIEYLVKLHPGKRLRLHIADPNFGGNIRVTEELCDRIIEFRQRCPMDIRIFISVRTGTMANHPRLVEKLCRAGVDYVFVGMESPNAEDLKRVRKLGGGDGAKQETAVRLLRENGAAVMSCFLLGLPGQTEESAFQMLAYARALGLEDAYFSVVCPLPGSELYDEVLARGDFIEPDHRKWRLYDFVMKHDNLTPDQVRDVCVRVNSKWYDDLMLPQAFRRYQASGGKKIKLHDYASKFGALVGFFQFLGDDQGEVTRLDPYVMVQELPNPGLKAFTSEHGLQEFLEMDRFLGILGDMLLQVTLEFTGGRQVSWVLKAKEGRVEYVECIHGRAEEADVSIHVSMVDGQPAARTVVKRILKDNASVRARLALGRLVAATASEAAMMLLRRLGAGARSRGLALRAKVSEGEERLAAAGRILAGRSKEKPLSDDLAGAYIGQHSPVLQVALDPAILAEPHDHQAHGSSLSFPS